MQIQIDIPADRIATMMISAMESGDPVTTAGRGGWCNGINLLRGKAEDDIWYACPKLWSGDFQIEIVEVDDESTGHETSHTVGPAELARGLAIMATKFPHIFKQVLDDDTDAPCADILLQCTLFGDEKYA